MPHVPNKYKDDIFFVVNIKDRPRIYLGTPGVEVGIVITNLSWSVLSAYSAIVEYELNSIRSVAADIIDLAAKWYGRSGSIAVISSDPWRDKEMLQFFLGHKDELFDRVFGGKILGTQILELFTNFKQPDISCLTSIDGALEILSELQKTNNIYLLKEV